MTGVFGLCAAVLCGIFLVLLLRQYHPVFAMLVSLAFSVVLLARAVQLFRQIREGMQPLLSVLPQDFSGILFRLVGVGLLIQTAADLCRESGQPALEGKVILLGKMLILSFSLPLFGQVLTIIKELLL